MHGNMDLYVVNRDGTDLRDVKRFSGAPIDLRWSPDGKRLRFTLRVYGTRNVRVTLWEINADGTGLHPLLEGQPDRDNDCCGTWSPDGRDFVFESKRAWHSDLWVLHEIGGYRESRRIAPIQMTNGPLSFFAPVFSTDGRSIFAYGAPDHGQLARVDTKSGVLETYLGGLSAYWVDISSDGEWVTYVAYPERTLWRARVDGGETRQLTSPGTMVDGSSWSPNGKLIAYRAGASEDQKKIYLISRDGGTPQPLSVVDVVQGVPSWSPDGTQLTFGDVPERYGYPTGSEAIHTYDLARHRQQDVPGSAGLWTSRWSPDGRYLIALTIESSKGQRMMLFEFATKTWRALEADHVGNPTWSRDGRYVYYDTEAGATELRRISIPAGKVETIANLKDYLLTAAWAGLAPDNSPIVLRNIGGTEIYSFELARR